MPIPRRRSHYGCPSLRSGDGRPRFGHGPAADAAGRGLRRGLAFLAPPSRLRRPRLGSGWNSLAGARSPCASGVALGVKIGGVLRGVLPRSSALRASGGGARGDAVRGSPPRAQPRLRSALRLRLRLRASFKSAEDGGFPTPLVRPRLSRPFFGLISALWGLKMPPAPPFHPKIGLKRRCRPPATRPECPATRETRGHLLNGGLPARRGLWTAPGTVPTARGASGLGSGLRPSAAWSLNPLGIFNSPPIKAAPPATPPSHLRARGSPTSGPEKTAAPLRRTRGGRG